MSRFLTATLNSPRAILLGLVALLFMLKGTPVPSGNELIYLLAAYKEWHPDFLVGDWTFGRPWPEHWLFNQVAGSLTLVLPLPLLGWLGRLCCWVLGLAGLLRWGRHLGLSPSGAGLALGLWLTINQTIVGGDWMFKTFEAKSIGYVLFIFAVDQFLAGRDRRAAALLGLCFSFHPSVGVSAALGFGVALIAGRTQWQRFGRFVGWTFLWSLPGLIPLLPMLAMPGGADRETWQLLALIRMPGHLDPLSFLRREILTTYLLLSLVWFHARQHPDDHALQFSRWFLTGLGLLFTAGLVARLGGWYELLQVFPFRMFPLLAPLLFLLQVVRAFRDLLAGWRPSSPVVAFGLLGLMSLQHPLGRLMDQVSEVRRQAQPPDALARAFVWVAESTPPAAVVIMPPWRKESFALARRAQIVNWDAVRYDQAAEWKDRIEALGTPLDRQMPSAALDSIMQAGYDALSEDAIANVRLRYGGDYLVSRGTYPFKVEFSSGNYRVYRLSAR